MGCCYGFNGVGNELSAGQGEFHAVMAHSDAVADADGWKFHGSAASGQNALFSSFSNFTQMHVTGNNFIKGIDNTNEGLLQLLRTIAHSIEEGTMGGTGGTFFYNITAQEKLTPFPHVRCIC